MDLSRPPRSVKVLASNRRQIKSSVQRMLARLTELEENQQLSSIPEIRVFAKNTERYHGELIRVLEEMEENNPFADEQDAHDLECAEIVGLLQGANQRIVTLTSALLSESPSPEQCHDQQDADLTPHSATKLRVESECVGDGVIPERASNQRYEPVVPEKFNVKVCATLQNISSPAFPSRERGELLCTRCNGSHLNADCFPNREVSIGQSQKMNPSLSCPEKMSVSPHHPKRPLEEHQEMQPPTEPEAALEEVSSTVLDESDESVGPTGVTTLKTEELPDGELDVGLCQAVELGSLLSADVERDDAKSGVPAPDSNPVTAGLVKEKSDIAQSQAINDQVRSLPIDAIDVDIENRSFPCCVQPACAVTVVQEQSKRPTSKISDASGPRPRTGREATPRRTAKKPRLVWDPGVWQCLSPFQLTIEVKTTTRWQRSLCIWPHPNLNSQSTNSSVTRGRLSSSSGLILEAEPSTRGENVRP